MSDYIVAGLLLMAGFMFLLVPAWHLFSGDDESDAERMARRARWYQLHDRMLDGVEHRYDRPRGPRA